MPSHEVHCKITKLALGRPYTEVHSFKDQPFKFLGRRHRILRHDPLTNLALAVRTGDPGAFLAGTLHDATDSIDSLLKRADKRRRK